MQETPGNTCKISMWATLTVRVPESCVSWQCLGHGQRLLWNHAGIVTPGAFHGLESARARSSRSAFPPPRDYFLPPRAQVWCCVPGSPFQVKALSFSFILPLSFPGNSTKLIFCNPQMVKEGVFWVKKNSYWKSYICSCVFGKYQ